MWKFKYDVGQTRNPCNNISYTVITNQQSLGHFQAPCTSFYAVLWYLSPSSCKNTSPILHLSVYLRTQLFFPRSFLVVFGPSHPLSTMKHFALCAIRPGIHGRHPRGHINSTVRTKPPSCQLPSASIPTAEKERGRIRARGWGSLEKKREAGEK